MAATNTTISGDIAPRRKRWTQNTAWYLFVSIMEEAFRIGEIQRKVKREYFKQLLNDLCKKIGIKREDLDIIAGARAELYFDGEWSSVSFDAINDLAEVGTDIIFIEKAGVPEMLVEHADKYGIAMVNTRGYLTEYGKDLMKAAKESGANVAIMTDYDITGINIAANSPKDMPWIGIDDTTLEYFNLPRDPDTEHITAEATNHKIFNTVREKVEGNEEKNMTADERFANVDMEFLRDKRIEIDAVIARVGDERLWDYIMDKLKKIYPKRDYNRAISLPEKYSKEKIELLPNPTRKMMHYIMDLIEDGTEDAANKIVKRLKEVEGFLEVKEEKKKNTEELTKALSEYNDMIALDEKMSAIWSLPEFVEVSSEYDKKDTDEFGGKGTNDNNDSG